MNKEKIAQILSVLIVIGAVINENLSLLEQLGLNENLISVIKLVGLAFAALAPSVAKKIGGGGIKNPKQN